MMHRTSKFPCQWTSCERILDKPEDLFNHLSDDHVGRKSTNNLSLQCQWNNCGTVAAKRDHLASHLRVHLPLKPHQCPLCSKGFKRPQDLKKHERIHTVEHQASLLSNQPGYKPVRRRRKADSGHTYAQEKAAYVSPSKDAPELSSSDLSSYSPSYQSVNSQLKPINDYSNFLQHQDPLQDFIVDVLQNQSLPIYDEDMMDKLNSVAPALQYQQQQDANWTLPCEPEALPALQNWLEQLSANIQTDEKIYPDISVPSSTTKVTTDLLFTDDYDLYPKLNGPDTWSFSSPNANSNDINSASHPHQNSVTSESSLALTPPASIPSATATATTSKFLSPDYIHSPTFNVNAFSSATSSSTLSSSPTPYIKPSDAINFSSPTANASKFSGEPNKIFETSATEASSLTPVYDKSSAISFNDKKELMHIMNVFSSSKTLQKYKQEYEDKQQQQVEQKVEEKDEFKGQSDELDSDEYDDDSVSFICTTQNDANEESKSPYADLVGLIENLQVEDEETIRKRHVLLVDQLWNAVSRSV